MEEGFTCPLHLQARDTKEPTFSVAERNKSLLSESENLLSGLYNFATHLSNQKLDIKKHLEETQQSNLDDFIDLVYKSHKRIRGRFTELKDEITQRLSDEILCDNIEHKEEDTCKFRLAIEYNATEDKSLITELLNPKGNFGQVWERDGFLNYWPVVLEIVLESITDVKLKDKAETFRDRWAKTGHMVVLLWIYGESAMWFSSPVSGCHYRPIAKKLRKIRNQINEREHDESESQTSSSEESQRKGTAEVRMSARIGLAPVPNDATEKDEKPFHNDENTTAPLPKPRESRKKKMTKSDNANDDDDNPYERYPPIGERKGTQFENGELSTNAANIGNANVKLKRQMEQIANDANRTAEDYAKKLREKTTECDKRMKERKDEERAHSETRKRLEKEIDSKKTAIGKLQVELKNHVDEMTKQKKENRSLNDEITTMEEKEQNRNKTIEDQRDKIVSLKEKIKEFVKTENTHTERIEGLITENASLQNDIDRHKAKKRTLINDIKTLETEKKTLKEENDNLKADLKAETAKVKKLQSENDKFRSDPHSVGRDRPKTTGGRGKREMEADLRIQIAKLEREKTELLDR